jgi:hypothetical protein
MNKEFKYAVGNVSANEVLREVFDLLRNGQNLEAFVTVTDYYSNELAQFHVDEAIKAILETENAK